MPLVKKLFIQFYLRHVLITNLQKYLNKIQKNVLKFIKSLINVTLKLLFYDVIIKHVCHNRPTIIAFFVSSVIELTDSMYWQVRFSNELVDPESVC